MNKILLFCSFLFLLLISGCGKTYLTVNECLQANIDNPKFIDNIPCLDITNNKGVESCPSVNTTKLIYYCNNEGVKHKE